MGMLRAITLALGLAAAAEAAADGPVVVELYTSQGCSSCPPADELLGQLAARDDVIALGLHVDYWDYIGWADTFASPDYTRRQQGYARAAGSNMIYTPQMVIGGTDRVVGFRPMNVADLVMQHRSDPYPVEIEVSRAGEEFLIEAVSAGRREMVVQVVTYMPHQVVEIGRGENAGARIDYHNIVTSWQVIAEWDGSRRFEGRIRPQSDDAIAVIVQAAGYGPILGAARVE